MWHTVNVLYLNFLLYESWNIELTLKYCLQTLLCLLAHIISCENKTKQTNKKPPQASLTNTVYQLKLWCSQKLYQEMSFASRNSICFV